MNDNVEMPEVPEVQPKKKKRQSINRRILNVTIAFTVLFFGMAAFFVHFEYTDADEVINNTYNKRQDILAESVVRGEIHADNGEVLASTITNADGSESRTYPYGSLFSHVVGYVSNGKSGIELFYNFKMLTSNSGLFEIIYDDLTGKKDIGDNIVTTLNVSVQKAAANALGGNDGAVIAIEPDTGKIVAMVSKPDFNPNSIESDWDYIVNSEGNTSLLNRATNGLYPPGSTFKIFTLLEYMHENPDSYGNYAFECNGSLIRGESSIKCYNGNVHGTESLMDSFAYSCNSSFANIGLGLKLNNFNTLCKSLLFNSELPYGMSYSESSFSLKPGASEFDIMQTVIGQGKTQVSPLHLSLISSAIANGGTLMTPYLVDHIENHDGKNVKQYRPKEFKKILSKEDTKELTEYMRAVVSYGTGTKLKSDSYEAFGKTGTAQFDSSDRAHSLFTGFADNGTKKLAVCVVLEDMPPGSSSAVPAARNVFDAYFSQN